MKQLTGIRFTNDLTGRPRYVRVDLHQHGDNILLEDFLDSIDVKARKGEPTMPFDEFVKEENKRRGVYR
ncbi:MAG: hypothetical protein LBS80_05330 [Tannerella sp.]|jgi:hypothetical protein|nr:hypothetical protein [Tannerella sp.]